MNITGALKRTIDVNLRQTAQSPLTQAERPTSLLRADRRVLGPERRNTLSRRLRPPLLDFTKAADATAAIPSQSLVVQTTSGIGFMGLTHADQRNANGGNQFSVEPPTPAIAIGEGFILEGVNNAVQVYNSAGLPQLAAPVSSNQLFGLPPAIDRKSGVNGVFPTDMRVFYDADIRRWFVLQWAQLNDALGNPLNQSREWMAVSQTPDPTGSYTIYVIDTTNPDHPGCPCAPDYPQIGADQFGFYISSNEFGTAFDQFIDASILGISKASLAAGADNPTVIEFLIPPTTGFEFAIQPASSPPAARNFIPSLGTEYFLSSKSTSSVWDSLAIWSMTNTSSLQTSAPALTLTVTTVSTLTYVFPDVATQRPGALPYGASLTPPGALAYLEGGDNRILSLSYAAGQLFATLASQVADPNGRRVIGAAYVIISPFSRGGNLAGTMVRQGNLFVTGNHLLRPCLAVNSQGKGAIALTLVGPDYYPSAAYVTIDRFVTGSTVQVVAPGVGPEDGFTGYPNTGVVQTGVARWGDNSAAVVYNDGAIWMASEYIPGAPRTQLANWGTFIAKYLP